MNKENESGYGERCHNCSGYGIDGFPVMEWEYCNGEGCGIGFGYCEGNDRNTGYGDGESNGSGNEDFTGESVNTVI